MLRATILVGVGVGVECVMAMLASTQSGSDFSHHFLWLQQTVCVCGVNTPVPGDFVNTRVRFCIAFPSLRGTMLSHFCSFWSCF